MILVTIWFVIYTTWMLKRNNKVRDLRLWFIDNHLDLYDKLPAYENMLYSTKPLTKEYWLKYVNNNS